ncbi:hypothetical protein KSP40_PGU015061 [Platanthera guangdongensis]|uniref:Uncharacterized protein n=1 Tax=Platanthera guangdongensis TaxID=2320717 RepID=A0ABR2MTU2_9ASPA
MTVFSLLPGVPPGQLSAGDAASMDSSLPPAILSLLRLGPAGTASRRVPKHSLNKDQLVATDVPLA